MIEISASVEGITPKMKFITHQYRKTIIRIKEFHCVRRRKLPLDKRQVSPLVSGFIIPLLKT